MAAYEILLPLALILCLTKLFALGAHRIGFPAVIGMLLAGLLIGFLKYIPSESFRRIFFGEQIREWLSVFAKIGVVLIMFSTGLGTNLKTLKASGGASVVITLFGVIVPMALGTLVSYLFGAGEGLLSHLFYGAILTATSVSVTVATLKELGKLETKVGTSIVAAAVIDDVIGIVVLSVLTGFTPTASGESVSFLPDWWENAKWWLVIIKIVCFFVLAVALGLFLRKRFSKIENKYPHNRRVPILAICVCYAYAYVAEKIFGVADITGAYVAGLILGGTLRETPYVEVKTDVLGYMVFSPIFFATIGMNLDFSGFSGAFAGFGLCYVLVAVAGKLIGCGAAAKLCGFSTKDSYRVGCGMMVRAEVVLICTDKGISSGLVSPAVYPFVFMIIIVTSVLAPLLLKFSYKGELPLRQSGVASAPADQDAHKN
ncbi:MAG: cation:proton antiporter [Candidatus Borkfalkiaceae bacterium]|nr:cation:proton antiporter [Clostridia bacterium]MDY6223067.1 cation:proton antiporter [Christensenellaceae bacterium]